MFSVKYACVGSIVLLAASLGSAAIAKPYGEQGHLRTLCSEDGWLQHSFVCTKIMTRVKAVFCSLMSIKACASENSALQNSLSNGAYAGPPYWLIDDAGMNITVFLNMTGYSAPNDSATVLAPTIRYPESFTTERENVGDSTGNQEASTLEGHYDVHTTEGEAGTSNIGHILGAPTSSSNGEVEVSTTGHDPDVPADISVPETSTTTSTHPETSTTSSHPEASTSSNPPGTAANQSPRKNITGSNPEESTASQHPPVSTISNKPEVVPTTHNPEMSASETSTSTAATAEEPSESYKTTYKNKPRLQMDYFTSQLIADTVSKAVAEEIAKKLRVKLVEKLQFNQWDK